MPGLLLEAQTGFRDAIVVCVVDHVHNTSVAAHRAIDREARSCRARPDANLSAFLKQFMFFDKSTL